MKKRKNIRKYEGSGKAFETMEKRLRRAAEQVPFVLNQIQKTVDKRIKS